MHDRGLLFQVYIGNDDDDDGSGSGLAWGLGATAAILVVGGGALYCLWYYPIHLMSQVRFAHDDLFHSIQEVLQVRERAEVLSILSSRLKDTFHEQLLIFQI